ncbi:predicted protein [Streptomyces iranensis]|uniref:Uncharacterized protein n=1 Tax=Streptomyces iranensis TaxID=576784 RepID=A0A060ZAT1_9ACTN|nr:predicted protein [Streptomyces iranensis]
MAFAAFCEFGSDQRFMKVSAVAALPPLEDRLHA